MLFDMGNREALMEGAKRCLLEKGYAKTTARDIADAAGVSLAAIGYHYGSKESLLEQAFMAAMEDGFDDENGEVKNNESEEVKKKLTGGSIERFRAFVTDAIATFPERRRLLRLNLEMGLEAQDNPPLATFMSSAMQLGREELAEDPGGLDPERDGELVRQVGAFYSVLMTGIIAQYLMDREGFPSADDLAEGLRCVAKRAHDA